MSFDECPVETWGGPCPCCGSWQAVLWFGGDLFLCIPCGHEWWEEE